MALRVVDLRGTTDAAGAAVITAPTPHYGRLVGVEWVDGDLVNNNTSVLTCTGSPSGVVSTLNTLAAGEGDDDIWYYPTVAVHDLSAVGRFYNDETDEPVVGFPIVNGYLKANDCGRRRHENRRRYCLCRRVGLMALGANSYGDTGEIAALVPRYAKPDGLFDIGTRPTLATVESVAGPSIGYCKFHAGTERFCCARIPG